PPGALARRATRPLAETALDVHLGRRLRERKVAWPESGACRTEESRREMREGGLEIDEADSFVNGESLDLREHRCVTRIERIEAVHVARDHYTNRRRPRLERPD